jgi:hypothetical protein
MLPTFVGEIFEKKIDKSAFFVSCLTAWLRTPFGGEGWIRTNVWLIFIEVTLISLSQNFKPERNVARVFFIQLK